jgi:hypothetical protein
MSNISKKNQNIFIEKMKDELLKIGAIACISDSMQFDLKTKYGVLLIRIDTDNSILYTVYGRFIEVEKAPVHLFDNINSYSGKWNHHLTENYPVNAVNEIINNYKFLIN